MPVKLLMNNTYLHIFSFLKNIVLDTYTAWGKCQICVPK